MPAKAKPRTLSLRALARELAVNHSSLSAAVRDGRLDRGVRLDARGRVEVFDADLATECWRDVHTPQILEAERAHERAVAAVRRLAEKRPGAIVLHDRTMECQVTATELFNERNALSLLVTALTAELAGDDRAAIQKRIAARLVRVAELHDADESDIGRAERELTCALCILADDDDDDENKTEETP